MGLVQCSRLVAMQKQQAKIAVFLRQRLAGVMLSRGVRNNMSERRL